MTDLNNSPAAANLPAAANPPTAASSLQPPAIEGPLSLHAKVNERLLAFGAANAVALSLDGIPLNLLPATIWHLCETLEIVTKTAVDVSSAVSLAFAHPGPLGDPTPPGDRDWLAFTGPWVTGTLYGVVPLAPLTAIPDNNEKWFAITRGRYVGLTTNSAISLNAVTGVSSGLSNRLSSQAEALHHFNTVLAAHAIAVFE
ncbi:hypothetical protein C8F04DRAFT_1178283 [Mycena alexandri]|uniref:Uncharacterized protein n=1 Tax=Mycena alexandri TaxID=1745969 RepID=A0AAD6T9D0_9AGAR|nr:hypothetical protein C8F04DRAFT_1178283 [Mycena alexandri]